MGRPSVLTPGERLDRAFLEAYDGTLCISPRYERLVTAVVGTAALDGVEFVYPPATRTEEAAIADAGLGVYLTVTGSTARDHGLVIGEQLFPSETVLMRNTAESHPTAREAVALFDGVITESKLTV